MPVTMDKNERALFLKTEAKRRFEKYLPHIFSFKVNEAIEKCYVDGMEILDLTRAVYAYLHPTKEPKLYE